MYLDKLIKAKLGMLGACNNSVRTEWDVRRSIDLWKTAAEMINSNNYLRLLTLLNDGFIGWESSIMLDVLFICNPVIGIMNRVEHHQTYPATALRSTF